MSRVIWGASNRNRGSEISNIFGRMGKALTAQVGLMMCNIGKWLREEKLFEITGVGILISICVLSVLVGLMVGIRYDRSRNDMVFISGQKFQIVGLAQLPQTGDKVYVPVYKEVK